MEKLLNENVPIKRIFVKTARANLLSKRLKDIEKEQLTISSLLNEN